MTTADNNPISPSQLVEMMRSNPAFNAMPHSQQLELGESMAKVFGYLSNDPGQQPLAEPLAPNFDSIRNRGDGGAGGNLPPADRSQPAQPAQRPQQQSGAVGRAGGAASDVLGAIDFPNFVASLIQGTFQAIVDASIQQMEAYSSLLAETAKTVDAFMSDNVTDDMARDHLADNYGDIFSRDLAGPQPRLTVQPGNSTSSPQLPSFLSDLGFDSMLDIDDQAVEDVIIPETRQTLAETRHQTLATMVMMGINRVIVDDGEIDAKLIFNVDANEAMQFTFNESKPTNWNLAGTIGRNQFGANGIVVNTTNINTQSDLSVRAELTGRVTVRFRSESFPLERFADSAAIQLINNRARVPQPRETIEGTATAEEEAVETPVESQSILPAPGVAPTASHDPWAPRKADK